MHAKPSFACRLQIAKMASFRTSAQNDGSRAQSIFYNTPMISARFHACGAGLQSRFSNRVSTN